MSTPRRPKDHLDGLAGSGEARDRAPPRTARMTGLSELRAAWPLDVTVHSLAGLVDMAHETSARLRACAADAAHNGRPCPPTGVDRRGAHRMRITQEGHDVAAPSHIELRAGRRRPARPLPATDANRPRWG